MQKIAFTVITMAIVMTLGAAPALAECQCETGAMTSAARGAVHSQMAYRGGGYSAASERGVHVLRGKVPSNLNPAAARMQRQAIAADRAAFARASRSRAAQQRAAIERRSVRTRRGYRPAYSTLGRVFVRGPRIGARRGLRSNGLRSNGGRKGGFTSGGTRQRGGNRSVSFARRIRS